LFAGNSLPSVARNPHCRFFACCLALNLGDFRKNPWWHVLWLTQIGHTLNASTHRKESTMGNDTMFHQALTLEYEGRYADALALFRRCLDDPTFDEGDIVFHCAWCLENEKRVSEALRLYAHAAETTQIPSCKINCFFRSGWILLHEKDHAQAAEMFRRAIDYGDLVGLKNETYQHALYWYAVCLETLGRYLEALTWYRLAQAASPQLDPESRLRQLMCLVHVGMYDEALEVCRTFDAPCPEDFAEERYAVLQAEVQKERTLLEASLASFDTHAPVMAYAGR
jgi:tetratricopeptide (TPR) repeat protein